jgi:hypothetical protein
MVPRWIVAIALLAIPVHAGADSDTPTKKAKPAQSKKASKSSSKKKSNVFTRKIEAKRVYDGYPPGYAWPPTRVMDEASRACEAKLDLAGVNWKPAKREGRIVDPIVISDMMLGGIKYTNNFGPKASSTMECQLALALAAIGTDLYSLGVREVKFGSIFNWSYVGSANGTVLSRHAIGVAMDIASFVDDSGRDVKVVESYKHGEPLLLSLEKMFVDGSVFHNVITPKNDPISHYNHFHVEAIVDFRAPPRPPKPSS